MGINNSNYLGDERAEERLPGPDTELLGIDRGNEVEVDRLAAAVGVGPEIVLVDDATDCVVTRFIDGRGVAAEELTNEPMLADFVAVLRRVHSAGTVRTHFDVRAVARRQRDETARRSVVAPYDVASAFDIAGTCSGPRGCRRGHASRAQPPMTATFLRRRQASKCRRIGSQYIWCQPASRSSWASSGKPT